MSRFNRYISSKKCRMTDSPYVSHWTQRIYTKRFYYTTSSNASVGKEQNAAEE